MIKLVRLFSRLNIGGPSYHVVNLNQGLIEHGYDSNLVVGRTNPWEGNLVSYANEKNVQPYFINEFGATISVYNDFLTFIKLLVYFKKNKPTILHTHTFKAGLLGRIAGKLAGIPVIVHTYHGHLLNNYWSGLKLFILKTIEKNMSLITDVSIGVSAQVSADLVEAGIVLSSKMQTVELGFDFNYLQNEINAKSTLRKKLNIPVEHFVFGSACRLVPVKNMELLINSSINLLVENEKMHLIIVGEGPEKQKICSIKEKAEAKFPRLVKQIHLVDWIVPFQRELKDFDLYICSSRNEGTSVSVIEAMISEVAVASTQVGGMPSLLNDGEYGDLYQSENSVELISVIKKHYELFTTNDLVKEKQNEKLQKIALKIRNQFDVKRLCVETDIIYKNILLKKGLL